LTQTGQITSQNPLADGAGHTFLSVILCRSKNRQSPPMLVLTPLA